MKHFEVTQSKPVYRGHTQEQAVATVNRWHFLYLDRFLKTLLCKGGDIGEPCKDRWPL